MQYNKNNDDNKYLLNMIKLNVNYKLNKEIKVFTFL